MSYREPPVYVDNLLAMRGLCALGVLLVHSLGASDLSFRHYLEHGWEFGATLRGLVAGLTPTTGKNFVLFFFVHSGYLMGKIFFMGRYTLDRRRHRQFYRSRLLRIAPLLYVNLVVCLLLLPSAQPTWLEAAGDFLFVNNFTGRGINGVTWSLSWEMQYYLVAPFVFLCFGKPTPRALAIVLALAHLVRDHGHAGHQEISADGVHVLLPARLRPQPAPSPHGPAQIRGLEPACGRRRLLFGQRPVLSPVQCGSRADCRTLSSAWRRRCPSSCSSCRAPTSVRRCRSKATAPFGCSCSDPGPGSASSPTGSDLWHPPVLSLLNGLAADRRAGAVLGRRRGRRRAGCAHAPVPSAIQLLDGRRRARSWFRC